MIVTPSTKAKKIKETTCYFYPGGFLFGTSIIIDEILVFPDFMKSYHS